MAATDLFIGLMSGTSLDGIDGVLLDWSGSQPAIIAAHARPMPASLRTQLLALQSSQPDELHSASLAGNALSHEYAEVVSALLARAGVPAAQIRAIGNHGQTIRHRPECGYTLQLGNHALLAELTGITVIGDFRSRDIAAKGQGAPLVPAFHQAVFACPGIDRAVVNIGGFANVSWLAADGTVSGWDTGPGNVLMDLWVQESQGHTHDENGQWAASGQVDAAMLDALLADTYFLQPPPKSTGRDYFHRGWLGAHLQRHPLPAADVQATLCRFTARSIAREISRKGRPETVYICGGGAFNARLLADLAAELPASRILTTAALGIAPQWVEATAFAWLAARCLAGQSGNLPAVTGAHGPRVLGAIWPG
ncbi:anhydro-N-acetylmuramic acid kinase [Chitinilyticum piscinae]|uniref:Anhydro-N-acetylmuramic acid kinase n=1 Tax=Chitinilyticum piscinae TaxID=2866724 RepID=A0A8J7FJS4_9NEIS|nr:anhydro-N-acetylmuramic acid kinase [Chitinilyticum piscinae]MBE9608862.1 anhydro-N-acetylmuramic acid kinase [Chitinilyticum piscinae]